MSYQLGQFRRPQLDSYSTFAADEELFTKIQSEVKTLLNIYLNWEFIMLETLI